MHPWVAGNGGTGRLLMNLTLSPVASLQVKTESSDSTFNNKKKKGMSSLNTKGGCIPHGYTLLLYGNRSRELYSLFFDSCFLSGKSA